MQVALAILIIVMGVVVHSIYNKLFTVIHFSFRSVFTEWFWCIACLLYTSLSEPGPDDYGIAGWFL